MQKWQEIKDKYNKRLTNQNAEDLIARRIWDGLGLPGSVKNISQVEQQLLSDTYSNDPIYDRVLSIFKYLYTGKMGKFEYWCETLEIKEHKDIVERITDTVNFSCGPSLSPVFFTRIKNTDNSLAYILEHKNEFAFIYTPPYHVLPASNTNYLIIVMPTVQFVSQFGPYCLDNIHIGKTNE